MTTEEERKAAHIAIAQLVSPSGNLCYTDAIDERCARTRTEKRLEVAEGLLRRVVDVWFVQKSDVDINILGNLVQLGEAAQEIRAFLNPPAEGE